MIKTIGFISGLLLMSVASSAFATTVKQEPPMGAMRQDQVLLVDDGSCPTGQIKRVVGGITLRWAVQNKSCEQSVAFRGSVRLPHFIHGVDIASSRFMARSCRTGMSAPWSRSGVNRT
jgi:hypothetical protein